MFGIKERMIIKKLWKDSASIIILGQNVKNAIEHEFNYKVII